MQPKKFILALFIVFSLSFSYQPVSIFAKEKESIVYILNFKQDNFTNDFIKKNEDRKLSIRVSLTLLAMICNAEKSVFNTS